MLDVHLPLADGRQLVLPRYTQPEPEHRLAEISWVRRSFQFFWRPL
jgi:hypothetical protein